MEQIHTDTDEYTQQLTKGQILSSQPIHSGKKFIKQAGATPCWKYPPLCQQTPLPCCHPLARNC